MEIFLFSDYLFQLIKINSENTSKTNFMKLSVDQQLKKLTKGEISNHFILLFHTMFIII